MFLLSTYWRNLPLFWLAHLPSECILWPISTLFYSLFMSPWILFAVKHLPLFAMTIFGLPKHKLISFIENRKISSDLSYLVSQAIGQPVRCSTTTRRYFSPVGPSGKCPAKSIKNLSWSPVKLSLIVVLYFGIFLAFSQPWQTQTYSYSSKTTLCHQYFSNTSYLVGSKSQW